MIDRAIKDHEEKLHTPKSRSRKKKKPYTPEFEAFWGRFKGRYDTVNSRYIKVRKREAFEEWGRLSIEEQRRAWRSADKVSGEYTPDACRWLKNSLYDDY